MPCHVTFDDLPDDAHLRAKELVDAHIVPFSLATLHRHVAAGDFPPPIKFSAGVSAWKVGTLRKHFAALPTGRKTK